MKSRFHSNWPVGVWGKKVGGWLVIVPDHETALLALVGVPWGESEILQESQRDGPKGFRDDLKMICLCEMPGDFISKKPLAASAVWIDEIWICLFRGINMIEEAAVDELLRDDCLISITLREVVAVAGGELKLMITKTGDFSKVIIAGIGTGEFQAVFRLKCEVELGCEFEVDELVA